MEKHISYTDGREFVIVTYGHRRWETYVFGYSGGEKEISFDNKGNYDKNTCSILEIIYSEDKETALQNHDSMIEKWNNIYITDIDYSKLQIGTEDLKIDYYSPL